MTVRWNHKPTPEQVVTSMAQDLHILKELILGQQNARTERQTFAVPELPITDEDRERFQDALDKRRPFSETYPILDGKLSVTFRAKMKRETDILMDQIDQDFAAGHIRSQVNYNTLLNNYNLMLQMVDFRGVKVPSVVPPVRPFPKDWSLYGCIDTHLISTLDEDTVILLLAALQQFDSRSKRLRQEAVEKSFPQPAGVS